jgi:hypothetical protein
MPVSPSRVLPSQDWKVCQYCLSMRDSAYQVCDKTRTRLWQVIPACLPVLDRLVPRLRQQKPQQESQSWQTLQFFWASLFWLP